MVLTLWFILPHVLLSLPYLIRLKGSPEELGGYLYVIRFSFTVVTRLSPTLYIF